MPGPWEAILEKLAAAVAPRYQVQRLLAYGGMAGVYLAGEPRLGRQVAIKVMAPGLMLDQSLVQRFEQEARTIAQFSHPNIITIYEVDQRDGLNYFVMNYLPGRTLAQVMAEGTGILEIAVIRAWLFQVGDALSYAHQHGVIHRDVKPGNVLLDARGNAVVSDFGIAKVADAETGFTRTGMLVGTPAYMSPEQCTSGQVTEASDQYALGAVLYQMLTGQPPFSGQTLSVLQAHATLTPAPVEQLRPDCPPELTEAVRRMLNKRAEDRFPSLGAALVAAGARAPGLDDPLREVLRRLALPAARIRIDDWRATVAEGTRQRVAWEVLGPEEEILEQRLVRWRSSDPVVATVLEGELLATRPGEAALQATCGPATTEVMLLVQPDPVKRLELAIPVAQAAAGSRVQATALAYDLDGTTLGGRAVLWSSADPDIARVRADGLIHALAPGDTIITASTGGCSAAAELRVLPRAGTAEPSTSGHSRIDFTAPVITGTAVAAAATSAQRQRRPGATAESQTAAAARAAPSAQQPAVAAAEAGELVRGGGARKRYWRLLVGGGVVASVAAALVVTGMLRRDPNPKPHADARRDTAARVEIPRAAPRTAAESQVQLEKAGAEPPVTAPLTAANPGAPPPPTETEPREGTIEVVGQLPPGTEIRVRTSRGEIRSVTGQSISLPAGDYEVEFSASGWETATRTAHLRAGSTVRITPTMRQLASSPPPSSPPPAAPVTVQPAQPTPDLTARRAEAEARVREVVDAIARRDAAAVLPLFTELQSEWRTMLTDRRSISDFTATAESVRVTSVSDSEITVELRLALSFRSANVKQQPTMSYRVRLVPQGASFRVVSLSIVR